VIADAVLEGQERVSAMQQALAEHEKEKAPEPRQRRK
jgi:hypothetical protein